MTYSPAQAGIQTGEDYFTSIGLIGGSTGMAPLISATTTFPTPQASSGTPMAVTNSVLYSPGASPPAFNYAAWNLDGSDGSTAYSKVLSIVYGKAGAATSGIGLVPMKEPYNVAADVDDGYWLGFEGSSGKCHIYEENGGWISKGLDTSIYQKMEVGSAVWGICAYVAADVQKLFIKSGTSNWFQVLSVTDDSFDSFKSIAVRLNYGTGARFIAPFYVWGLEE